MIPSQLTESVLALPERDRLELARRFVESIATDRCPQTALWEVERALGRKALVGVTAQSAPVREDGLVSAARDAFAARLFLLARLRVVT